MMRTLGLACLGITCAWGAVAVAAEGPAEALTGKGLRKAGLTYILPAEADVAKAANAVRAAQKTMAAATARQREVDGQIEANKQMVVEFTQQRRVLREQVPGAGSVAEHNQIVQQMNELGDRINLLHAGGEDEQEARKQAGAAASEKREAFVQAIMDSAPLIEDIDATYDKLKADAEVIAAIQSLNVGAKPTARVALGPSKAYLANVKALQKARASIQSESIPLREDNGTFTVDVVLNGKVTQAMVFDTGAAVVSLPAAVAARAGINPTADDPTIRMQTADGRTHEAKQMTLQSVRVGKFTATNVICVVVPPDLADAPPLLGGSFLKSFTYKLMPEAGKLTLSRIGEEEPAPSARPAAKGSAGKKSASSKRAKP